MPVNDESATSVMQTVAVMFPMQCRGMATAIIAPAMRKPGNADWAACVPEVLPHGTRRGGCA